jgi:hypothetical protein
MSIIIEADGMTVLLPETQSISNSAEKMREFIKKNPVVRSQYLFPLFDAVATFAVSLVMVPQGCETFELPRNPWIVYIGDDMHFAWGPQAFGAIALEGAILAADNCVLVTSGPDPFPYRYAATMAVKPRKNVLLIDSLPHQQEAWRQRIEKVRGTRELPIFCCIPLAEACA